MAVGHDLGAGVLALEQPQFDAEAGGEHDRPVGKRVRRDRYDDDRVQPRFDYRSAAAQRVRRRAGRRRNDQAVARVRVHVAPVHARDKVEHAACLAALQDHVIQGKRGRGVGVGPFESRLQNEALVGGELASQHVADAVEHLLRRYIREESEAAPIDAE